MFVPQPGRVLACFNLKEEEEKKRKKGKEIAKKTKVEKE